MVIHPAIFYVIGAFFLLVILSKSIKIVPNQWVYVVERLGKYSRSLSAGFHVLVPFIDRVAYKQILKEIAEDVTPQNCITKDNIIIEIDGVLFYRIIDPVKASYAIQNHKSSIIQLAKTTMRSEIGKLSLDETLESRESINNAIVTAVDDASDPWGIKVTRYEIKDLVTPQSLREAMEKQMRAEREKRALIAKSEGEKMAKINIADGDKQSAIKKSEGQRIKIENEAKGKATEILEVAKATAEGVRQIGSAIREDGGKDAVSLRIATDWIQAFGNLAKESNSMIIPTDVSNIASVTSILGNAFEFAKKGSRK